MIAPIPALYAAVNLTASQIVVNFFNDVFLNPKKFMIIVIIGCVIVAAGIIALAFAVMKVYEKHIKSQELNRPLA